MTTSQFSSHAFLDSNNPKLLAMRASEDSIIENLGNHSASSLSSSSSASSQSSKFKGLSQLYYETQAMTKEEVCHLSKEEPGSVVEALKERIWKAAMDKEMNQIMKNNMWSLVIPPESCKPIRLKWVFKIKRGMTGQLIKNKARLVVKG